MKDDEVWSTFDYGQNVLLLSIKVNLKEISVKDISDAIKGLLVGMDFRRKTVLSLMARRIEEGGEH